ncbi:MAG: prolyl oligopeptidase family serine peptidase [Bacteroidales bacterium]|nr:prolyl oligopeptidase family serine peptidase [Bacteroidales bacterium]
MKAYYKVFVRPVLFAVSLTILIVSCENDNGSSAPEYNNQYLVSYELINSYNASQVQSSLILGSILYPEIDTLVATSVYGAEIYKITYKTTFRGGEIIASGLVSVPDASNSFPLLSFQNGTNTCHSNAPTVNTTDRLYTLIGFAAGNGYIVAIADYIGFGASKQVLHPYHHRESNNRAVIDLLQAVLEFTSTKNIRAKSNGQLFLMGYSQGGWATLSVLNELENNALDSIQPVAASCGAGAYDMVEMGRYIVSETEYSNPFYLPYFIQSHIANGYMQGSLATYFNEPYASSIPSLFDGNKCNTEMNNEFPQSIPELLAPKLLSEYETAAEFAPLRNELQENSIPAWKVKTPLLVYHSRGDKSVPFFESEQLYANLLGAGVPATGIKYIPENNTEIDHGDAVVPWGIETLAWFSSMK